MAITKRRYLDIILGIFVLVGLILLGTFIFLIGKERRLFDDAVYISAYYPNVAGLSVGADVLLAGVVVGRVSTISFPPLSDDSTMPERKIRVILRISSDRLEWIRRDSVARIDSKGLLGDKTINISMGVPDSPAVEDGGVLKSIPPVDFNDALAKAESVLTNVTESIKSARKFLDGFTSEGGDIALANTVKTIQDIISEVHKGDGIIHKLVYDKETGKEFEKTIDALRGTVESIELTSRDIQNVVAEVKTGKGLLHSLIYDKKGENITKLASEVLSGINTVLDEVKSGSGIVHGLIYDSDQGNLISNLNAAAADLKSIMASVKSGQGTVGRLLVDPSIYEDLKLILGRVKRNEVLKSLIRFSLPKDGNSESSAPEVIIENP